MAIAVECPGCGTQFEIPPEMIGATLCCAGDSCQAAISCNEIYLKSDFDIATYHGVGTGGLVNPGLPRTVVQFVSAAAVISLMLVIMVVSAIASPR